MTFSLPNIYSVGADEKEGIESCVDYLARRGRRNLILVVNKGRISGPLIRSSFEGAIKKGEPRLQGAVYTGIPDRVEEGEHLAFHLLREHPEVDGIICTTDLIAIGLLNILKEKGIAVPQQIALIGEHNSAFCETCRPRLTSLDAMITMSSIMGARTLLDVLDGREPSRHVTLRMTIVERGTT